MNRRALIIVDVQNDFCEGGALGVDGGTEVAHRIAEMDTSGYGLVVTTQDWHIEPGDHFETWPVHCVADTAGARLHAAIRSRTRSSVKIYKGQYSDGYSGFDGKTILGLNLNEVLTAHSVLDVDIVGLAFDYCVRATALDAVKRGFDTTVLANYTAPVDPSKAWSVVQELTEAGVEIA